MEIMWKMGGQHIIIDGDQRYSIRGQTLADGMVSELGIERTIRQDTGVFTCSASNAYGHDDMNIQLIVQEIPEPPRNVRVLEQLSRSIGLSWTQPYAGNSPINNYIVQYKPGLGKQIFHPTRTKVETYKGKKKHVEKNCPNRFAPSRKTRRIVCLLLQHNKRNLISETKKRKQ